MTVRFVNREVRIPLSESKAIITGLAVIISALVGGAWKMRAYYDTMLQEKKETNTRLIAIEKHLNIKSSVDSLQDAKIANLDKRVDTMQLAGLVHHSAGNKATVFYIERKVNGKIVLVPASNSTMN